MIDIEKLVGNVSREIKKGSTRLVYFPVNKRKIVLDGIETDIEIVLKVAKPHKIEVNSDNCDLGKFQNKIETHYSNNEFFAFIKNSENDYCTNYNGILTPIFDHSIDYSWIKMAKVYPVNVAIFNKLTINEDYPAGLYFPDVENSVKKYYIFQNKEEGVYYSDYIDDNKYNIVIQHPWVKIYIFWMEQNNMLPYDFVLKNLGYIKHPISNKEILVLCDYGYSQEYANYFDLIEAESV